MTAVQDGPQDFVGEHDGADTADRYPLPVDPPSVLHRLEGGEPITEGDREALADLVYTLASVTAAAPVILGVPDPARRGEELAAVVRLACDTYGRLQ